MYNPMSSISLKNSIFQNLSDSYYELVRLIATNEININNITFQDTSSQAFAYIYLTSNKV